MLKQADNNGAFRSEGDSPSYMHQIEVGLRSLEHPTYGGWGGRFQQEKPGTTVTLSVAGSSDPDGDKLEYSWWQYREAGTYKGEPAAIRNDDRAVAWAQIPADAKPGETLHFIAEVTDSGKPPITRYARVIVTVKAR